MMIHTHNGGRQSGYPGRLFPALKGYQVFQEVNAGGIQ